MKKSDFQLSPDFNRKVLKAIKLENSVRIKEVRQLWRFSLITAASAAIVAIIFMVNPANDNLSGDFEFDSNLNDIELTIDYWSNN
ncbi:MAG: hypothetical protein KAG98_01985 [Lentisphaeria bacterium]|nr:hypothetical protein [Lentisphaeria bacterium]